MGLFDFLKTDRPNNRLDINSGLAEYRNTPGAKLIDVRTYDEYVERYIPGSINVPLQDIQSIKKYVSKLDTPLYLYCRTGARSSNAASLLINMGYTSVHNIGGIMDWRLNEK